jgi:hypothetical protein
MPFQAAILLRFEQAFARWEDLARGLPDEAFGARLPAPSNSIGAQFWCVVGARESYARALAVGAWQGFACSLTGADIATGADVLAGLTRSAEAFRTATLDLAWTEARLGLLLDLLEHETQHQGQLIRYLYALRLGIPDSWKQRWALE